MDTAVKVVRLHRLEGDTKTKAFVDVGVGDFVVKGLRVVQGKEGLFLAMPQEKARDGKYYNSFFAVTDEARDALAETVLAAFRQ